MKDKKFKNTSGPQRRVTDCPVEYRASEDNTDVTVYGYAARFSTPTTLYDFGDEIWREQIEPGFFDDVLEDDVRCLIDHKTGAVLARTSANNLKIGQDEKGLWYEFVPQGQSYAQDLVINLRTGNINQSSFGFMVRGDGSDYKEETRDGVLIVTRTLKRGGCKNLLDVSPVTYPAYPTTEVGLKSDKAGLEEFKQGLEEFRARKTPPTPKETDYTKELLEIELLGLV